MKPPETLTRGFIHYNRAWYAKTLQHLQHDFVDEVNFARYSSGGGVDGEMAVRWYLIGEKVVPKLECFDDGWRSLATFSDLIAELGKRNDQNITPAQFCDLLRSLGFEDRTEERDPYQDALEAEMLDMVKGKPCPAWIYRNLVDNAREAVDALIERGELIRDETSGDIRAA